MEELVNKKVVADVKVKRLQNKLSYTKRKVHYCYLEFFSKLFMAMLKGTREVK